VSAQDPAAEDSARGAVGLFYDDMDRFYEAVWGGRSLHAGLWSGPGDRACGRNATWPVCSKPEGNTEQGLCDMLGNVWQWTQDWYHSSYEGAPGDGSAWENPADTYRVHRGMSWYHTLKDLRAENRCHDQPDSTHGHMGFRPVRDRRPRPAPGRA